MEPIPLVRITSRTGLTITTHLLPDDDEPHSPTAVCIQFLCRGRVGGVTAGDVIIGRPIETSFDKSFFNLPVYVHCALSDILSGLPIAPWIGQARRDAFVQQLVREGRRVAAAGRREKLSALFSTTLFLEVVRELGNGTVPAAESAVRELIQKGTAAVESDGDGCVICLEELPRGTQATRLPCSHAFHGDCIVPWLERSHYCPVCRYQMPTDTAT